LPVIITGHGGCSGLEFVKQRANTESRAVGRDRQKVNYRAAMLKNCNKQAATVAATYYTPPSLCFEHATPLPILLTWRLHCYVRTIPCAKAELRA
jgi:hypothetical protein